MTPDMDMMPFLIVLIPAALFAILFLLAFLSFRRPRVRRDIPDEEVMKEPWQG